MSESIDQLSENREAFFARIRKALRRSPGDALSSEVPVVDPAVARLADASDDLVGLFVKNAEAVGFSVYRCNTATLAARLAGAVEVLGATRLVVADGLSIGAVDVTEELSKLPGVGLIDWHGQRLEPMYDVGLGVTGVDAALAETGTLIASTANGQSRGLSLVPPAHLAIVKASQVLPDMIDYWATIAGRAGVDLPSSLSFITGPSKTADIEGVLITGVHGPGRVVVLVVEDA